MSISKVFLKPLRRTLKFDRRTPYTIHFTQNEKKKTWDLFMAEDSIAVVIFNTSRNVLVFVKQFQPVVYYGSIPNLNRQLHREIDVSVVPSANGITIELCGGEVTNKKLPLVETGKKVIFEKCCYDVPSSHLEKIGSYYSGVGVSANLETAFYCEVTDDMKVPGCEGTNIEVVEMTIEEAKTYINQVNINSPSNFMFGIFWFLRNKVKKENQ